MGIAELIAGIVALAGSAIGAAVAAGDRDKARKIQEDAAARINAILPPEFERITPEEITSSEFENLNVPSEGRNAQLQALAALTDTVANKGDDAQFRDDWRVLEGMVGKQNAAMRGAAQNYAAARGLGQQAQYVAQLSDAQNSANNASAMSSQMQAAKQARYLDALKGLGSLGGALGDSDYRRAADRAKAMDYVNVLNTGRRMDAANANNQWRSERFKAELGKATGSVPASMQLAQGYGQDAAAAQATGSAFGAQGADLAAMFDEYLKQKKREEDAQSYTNNKP